MLSFKCPQCGGSDIVKRGKRKNKGGAKQLYRCNDCRSTFVEPDGFERMRHKPEDIVRAIHMYNDGLSLFNVKNHLSQHDNTDVSIWTISKWHKKYAVFLKSGTQKGKAKTEREATSGRKVYPSERRKR